MAIFPAGNPGAIPVDTSSDIGKWRAAAGDLNYTLYDPDEPGYANFVYASDAEITQFLAMSSDSIPGAVGYWYLQLAGQAAISAKQIRDYDLQVNTEKRAADLREQASFWFGVAGISLMGGEYFDIVPMGADPLCWPELAERPVWWP